MKKPTAGFDPHDLVNFIETQLNTPGTMDSKLTTIYIGCSPYEELIEYVRRKYPDTRIVLDPTLDADFSLGIHHKLTTPVNYIKLTAEITKNGSYLESVHHPCFDTISDLKGG